MSSSNKTYTKRKAQGGTTTTTTKPTNNNNVIDTNVHPKIDPFYSSTTHTKSIFEKDDEEEENEKTTITETEPSPKKIKQWDWRAASTALYSPSPSKKETKKSSSLKGKIGGEGKEKKQLEQLFLDLGQRNFGPIICDDCKMMYTPGVKEDDDAHTKYHSKHRKIVDFANWRACKIAKEFPTKGEGIVVVVKTDPASQWKKAMEVRAMMDKELGWVDSSSSSNNNSDQKIFIYVNKSKKVVGCVVAERISEAFRVIEEKSTIEKDSKKETSSEQEGDSNGIESKKQEERSEQKEKSDKNSENECEKKDKDEGGSKSVMDKKQHSNFTVKCSKIPTPVVCGISRIWVLDSERRKGIATKLLDCVCKNMIYGFCIPKDGLTFSQPTADGNRLFSKYTGRKDYLVYL